MDFARSKRLRLFWSENLGAVEAKSMSKPTVSFAKWRPFAHGAADGELDPKPPVGLWLGHFLFGNVSAARNTRLQPVRPAGTCTSFSVTKAVHRDAWRGLPAWPRMSLLHRSGHGQVQARRA